MTLKINSNDNDKLKVTNKNQCGYWCADKFLYYIF